VSEVGCGRKGSDGPEAGRGGGGLPLIRWAGRPFLQLRNGPPSRVATLRRARLERQGLNDVQDAPGKRHKL
jgi:hypothetical protein